MSGGELRAALDAADRALGQQDGVAALVAVRRAQALAAPSTPEPSGTECPGFGCPMYRVKHTHRYGEPSTATVVWERGAAVVWEPRLRSTPRTPPGHTHRPTDFCLAITCPRGAWDAALAAPSTPEPSGLPTHLDFCSGGEFCALDDCLCECHIR